MKIKDITGKLVLKMALGQGEYEGKRVDLSVAGGSLIISYDNKQYSVSLMSIVEEFFKELESKVGK